MCYELLEDTSAQSSYNGVDQKTVNSLTGSIRAINLNYGYDTLQRLLIIMCCVLACSQLQDREKDIVKDYLEVVVRLFTW